MGSVHNMLLLLVYYIRKGTVKGLNAEFLSLIQQQLKFGTSGGNVPLQKSRSNTKKHSQNDSDSIFFKFQVL